ncbi:hypothetical protein GCM10023085_24770 [Actinomadura viridis]|uniref:Uncharacterized protein n=1 Tax=Actinomadura viridis TaxID=58110 RepID=A0A931GJ24_9ACTN|nr:hypothetical protein [Actinomadura viridis]MBG6088850.1 hypothetical protein [Actinomadura viridis]
MELEQGVAVISQQIQQHRGHLTACPPKTASSARVIALDHTTVSALHTHRRLSSTGTTCARPWKGGDARLRAGVDQPVGRPDRVIVPGLAGGAGSSYSTGLCGLTGG